MMKPCRALSASLGFAGLCATFLLPHLAWAETSGWAENEGGRMRLTALPPDANGSVRAALEIEPKPGWITYWREPGESGIPPQVSVSGGAALGAIAYPVPKVLRLGTLTDVGYDAAAALPLTLQSVTGPAKVDAFIGLCKDICIPFQASFSLGLAVTAAKADEVMRIEAAEARLPAAASAGLTVKTAGLERNTLVLEVAAPGQTGPVEAILTGPPGGVFLASGPIEASGSASLRLPLDTLASGTDPARVNWTVLLKTEGKAVEQKITLP